MIGSSSPYEIQRQNEACAATGRALEAGERHVAVLVDQGDQQPLLRQLFSIDAWENGARPDSKGAVFGTWRRVAPDPGEPANPMLGLDELFDLFEQLGDQDDPRQVSFRYLLALLLMRKRRLVYEGKKPDDHRVLVLKARPGGTLYEVADPSMDEETIAQATEELGRVMRIDLDGGG